MGGSVEPGLIILIAAIVCGGYMAWTIGANDVANAFGTSVGSGAIKLITAVLIAAIFEFSGAFFVGSHVAKTVGSDMLNLQLASVTPTHVALGMVCALLASGVWLHFASHLGWPVSTTHAIVGAVAGLAIVLGGINAIEWKEMWPIVLSWVVSPLCGALLAVLAYTIFVLPIYRSEQPIAQLKRTAPLATGLVFMLITLSMVYKGLKNLHLDMPFPGALLLAGVIGLVAGIVAHFLLRRRQFTEGGTWLGRVRQTEPIFAILQVVTACYMSFAHGANDVANSIGPLATVYHIFRTGQVSAEITVPPLLLALGGAGIVIGLSTYGYKVIQTVGKKITDITPSRGFSAEFGCATTVLLASKLGLPISTTHTIVGAVVGVGMVRGLRSLDLRVLRDIGGSWIATIPCAALLTALFYALLLPLVD